MDSSSQIGGMVNMSKEKVAATGNLPRSILRPYSVMASRSDLGRAGKILDWTMGVFKRRAKSKVNFFYFFNIITEPRSHKKF
jgi:hypothetical protein